MDGRMSKEPCKLVLYYRVDPTYLTPGDAESGGVVW